MNMACVSSNNAMSTEVALSASKKANEPSVNSVKCATSHNQPKMTSKCSLACMIMTDLVNLTMGSLR